MSVVASWVLYDNSVGFTRLYDTLPYLTLEPGEEKVVGLKFQGSQIKKFEIYLKDEFADIFYTDSTPTEYNVNLINDYDLEIEVCKFWAKNVKAASTANLSATYANGDSGFGATLTSSSNQRLELDGQTLYIGDLVLIKNQSTALQNGIYIVTDFGKANPDGRPWVLTRIPEADSGLELVGMVSIIEEGTINTNKMFFINETSITIGSTALTFTEITSTEDIPDSPYWTNILAKPSAMLRYEVNSAAENRKILLNKQFEGFSYLIGIRLINNEVGLTNFKIRNLKIAGYFETEEPTVIERPIKIFADGVPIIRKDTVVEYYLATTTADNLTYTVTGKTWTSADKIEVFRQPTAGIYNPVSPNEYLASGNNGTITFLSIQSATIFVTITRPLQTGTTGAV
jgi:hypothetical protein